MINDISTSHIKEDPLMAEVGDGTGSTVTTVALTPEVDAEDPENTNIEIVKNGNETDIQIPNYTVRGELGSLITNELNEIFKGTSGDTALENVPVVKLTVDGIDGNGVNKDRASYEGYLYASDLKHINKEGVSQFICDVLKPSSEKFKDKVCYIDLNESPKGNIDLAISILQLNDVSVVFSKKSLVEHFKHDKA